MFGYTTLVNNVLHKYPKIIPLHEAFFPFPFNALKMNYKEGKSTPFFIREFIFLIYNKYFKKGILSIHNIFRKNILFSHFRPQKSRFCDL